MSYALEVLSPKYRVSVLFYNPNIMPRDEFDKRSAEFSKLFAAAHYPNHVEFQLYRHDRESFAETAERYQNEPEGGRRCRECFYIRLEKTASLAKSQKHDYFATALTVSPHKNAALINDIGSEVSQRHQIEYIASDFKKQNGYKRSVELSKLYGLYRQNYCGCWPHFAKKGEGV